MNIVTAPLTAAQEAHLLPLAQAGDLDAQARLVTSQVPQLRQQAVKYAAGGKGGLPIEDLVSAGMEAVLGAIHTFDTAKGVRFYTHWKYAAQEAMANEVARVSNTSLVVPGTTLRKYRKAFRDAERSLQQEARHAHGGARPWTVEDAALVDRARELAQRNSGMAPETFAAVHFAVTQGHSLNDGGADFYNTGRAIQSERGDATYAGHGYSAQHALGVPDPSESPYTDAPDRATKAVAALTPRERAVIDLTLYTDEPLSDREAADILGSTRSTVQRIRARALSKMHDALTA